MALTIDTRTATEYGVVRTFGQGDFQFSTLGSNTFNPNTINQVSPIGSANLLDTAGGGYVAVEMVFIQFAGFTFGKSASAYATPWHGYPGNNNSFLMGGHDTVTGVNNIQYTAELGNGVSLSVGLDDPTVFNRTIVLNLSWRARRPFPLVLAPRPLVPNAYGGVWAADIVGRSASIRLGVCSRFRRGAAFRERFLQRRSTPGGSPSGLAGAAPNGVLGSQRSPRRQVGRFGDGCVAGREHPTGVADDFKIDVRLGQGPHENVISPAVARRASQYSVAAAISSLPEHRLRSDADGVYFPVLPGACSPGDARSDRRLRCPWSFNHNWDPYWSISFWGSYAAVRSTMIDLEATTSAHLCAGYSF